MTQPRSTPPPEITVDPSAKPPPPVPPAARPRRPVAWIVAGVALLVLLGSTAWLALEIAGYQKNSGRRQYYYRPVDATSFSLGGLPVTITEVLDEQGAGQVIVNYAQDTLRLGVEIPNPNALPLLLRHENWLRVMSWADGTGMNVAEFDAARATGERPENYVIVTRALGPGAPAGGWGDVWRHEWVFNFYTFEPPPAGAAPGVGGGFSHERFEYPESPRAFARRVNAAALNDQPPPERNPRELKEGTWEYGAAMLVMPSGSAPAYAFNEKVLIENRWLIAAASVSIITLLFSVALAVAPARVK